jgi:hypothetical protein
VAISTAIYLASLPVFFRLVHADHLTPAWLRAARARLPLTLAALLLILGGPRA